MPVIVKDNRKEYPPAPEGLHQAVCVDVIEHPNWPSEKWGPKDKIELRWQLEERDTDGRRYVVTNWYTASLNEKAILRKTLEAWRGRAFTEQELQGFDIEKLIGTNCQIQVAHMIVTGGRVYGNVVAVVKLGKGMLPITAENYERVKDRNGNAAVNEDPDSDIPF